MKIRALLLLALALPALPARAQAQLPLMDLHDEARDGSPADVGGPAVVPAAVASDSRVWGAQGRRRVAWRVSDRLRFLDEEDQDFNTALQAVEADMDDPVLSNRRLFTLTARRTQQQEGGGTQEFPATIKVDQINDPTSPFPLQTLKFDPSEQPLVLRTIPDANLLLVVMLRELRVYDYGPSLLLPTDPSDPALLGAPIGVAALPTGTFTCSTGATHSYNTLRDVHVATIQVGAGEERMALVTATMQDAVCQPFGKPTPQGLLAVSLANPAQPAFYDTNLTTQTWHPCRPVGGHCEAYAIGGFAHVRAGGLDLVYVCGGWKVDLMELDVTGVSDPLAGMKQLGSHPLLPGDPTPGDPLFDVVVDPEAPAAGHDFLYLIGRQNVYAVDRGNLGGTNFVQSTPANLGHNGPAGDAHLMLDDTLLGAARRETWTLGSQNAPFVHNVTDFSQTGGGAVAPPLAPEGYYSAGPADGGVANFNWESVYLPTFGGVVRWDISGPAPLPNPNPGSYRPAKVGAQSYITEHLELVDLGPLGSPSWHLISSCAQGNFFSWPIDPTSHDPLAGAIHDPGGSYYPWAGGYGNDIAVGTDAGTSDKWVYVDHSHGGSDRIGFGRYNWTTGSWSTPPLVWEDAVPKEIVPNVRDLSVDGKWMLAAAEGGFLVVDLDTWQVSDQVYTSAMAGLSFTRVTGIERSDDRIFVSLGGPDRYGFAMYDFDPMNGRVLDPITGLPGDTPHQVLLDQAAPGQDDFPGVFLKEGERISLVQTQAVPKRLRLYSGTGNGHLVEIEWDELTDTMTAKSRWHNGGYFEEIADCNVYKIGIPGGFSSSSFGPGPAFTLRILVAKTRETFEIVSPPDMP